MRTLTVGLGDRSYPILIGAGLLTQAELIARHMPQKRAALVTNETVAPLYLPPFRRCWRARRLEFVPIVVPDGEAYKTGKPSMHLRRPARAL
jgi:3-dehydroquinate synthetase